MDVGTVDRSVAASRPTRSLPDKCRVLDFADKYLSRHRIRLLSMAFQTKV